MPKWPHEDVPESTFFTYPDGLYTVKVKSQEDGETKKGKFTIKVETRVGEPKQFRNQPMNFQFVIGTDSDPSADEPETWTQPPSVYAAGRYKGFLKACGTPFTGDTEEEAENTPGSIIVVEVGHHEDENGRTYNDYNAFYSESGAADKTAAASTAAIKNGKPATTKAASKKAAKAVEVDEDEDGDEAWE